MGGGPHSQVLWQYCLPGMGKRLEWMSTRRISKFQEPPLFPSLVSISLHAGPWWWGGDSVMNGYNGHHQLYQMLLSLHLLEEDIEHGLWRQGWRSCGTWRLHMWAWMWLIFSSIVWYVGSGVVADDGEGIGDGGTWIGLVSSLSMVASDIKTDCTNAWCYVVTLVSCGLLLGMFCMLEYVANVALPRKGHGNSEVLWCLHQLTWYHWRGGGRLG